MKKKVKKEVKEYSVFATYNTRISLDNWAKMVYVMKRISSTSIVEDDDYFYFKVYYDGSLTVEDKNEIFVSISSLPVDKGCMFLGVREYLENHEMCFVFKKRP